MLDTLNAGRCINEPEKPTNTHIEHTSSVYAESDTIMDNFHEMPTPPTTFSSVASGDYISSQDADPQSFNWNMAMDTRGPSWFIGDDFDLDAVNLALVHAAPDNSSQNMNSAPNLNITDHPVDSIIGVEDNQVDEYPSIQSKWHTYYEPATSGSATPTSSQRPLPLDESYRKRLADNLRQNVQHGILPSTPFLVRVSKPRSLVNLILTRSCFEENLPAILFCTFPSNIPNHTCGIISPVKS